MGVELEREEGGHAERDEREGDPQRHRRHVVTLILLFAGAALISGFTLLRHLEPFDEGLMLQAARRIADGELPYRDFIWVYGPGQPFLLAGFFEAFGTSLLPSRILRVALDAGVAVTVYVLVARGAPRGFALAAWLAAACAMAQPTSATPFPLPFLCGLLAVALVTARSRGDRASVGAGLLTGAAAVWRPDFALFAVAGVAASLAARGQRVRRHLGSYAAVAAGTTLLLYVPFLVAVGPADLFDALFGTGTRGRQNLPFPFEYEGGLSFSSPRRFVEDAKDLLGFYVPLLAVIGLAVAAAALALRWRRERRPPPLWTGLLALGAGGLAYLLSRSDEFHAAPLEVVVITLLPLCAVALRGQGRGSRLVAGAAVAVFALLLAAGLANRLSALFLPPDLERLDVAVADGVRVPPREAAALDRTVEVVQRRVPPGDRIYVATRRSDLVRINNPMLYVLTGRGNVYDKDFGPITTASAQRDIVTALATERALVIRWTDPQSTKHEPNPSARSSGVRTLDRYLRARYRLLERNGEYEVLVPR